MLRRIERKVDDLFAELREILDTSKAFVLGLAYRNWMRATSTATSLVPLTERHKRAQKWLTDADTVKRAKKLAYRAGVLEDTLERILWECDGVVCTGKDAEQLRRRRKALVLRIKALCKCAGRVAKAAGKQHEKLTAAAAAAAARAG